MVSVDRNSFLPIAPDRLSAQTNAKVSQAGATDQTTETMARELESTFLSLLLKEMRQTLEPEGLFAGDSSDVQGGLFDLYLGKHIADQGGVGLANAIIRSLNPMSHGSHATSNEPRVPHRA